MTIKEINIYEKKKLKQEKPTHKNLAAFCKKTYQTISNYFNNNRKKYDLILNDYNEHIKSLNQTFAIDDEFQYKWGFTNKSDNVNAYFKLKRQIFYKFANFIEQEYLLSKFDDHGIMFNKQIETIDFLISISKKIEYEIVIDELNSIFFVDQIAKKKIALLMQNEYNDNGEMLNTISTIFHIKELNHNIVFIEDNGNNTIFLKQLFNKKIKIIPNANTKIYSLNLLEIDDYKSDQNIYSLLKIAQDYCISYVKESNNVAN